MIKHEWEDFDDGMRICQGCDTAYHPTLDSRPCVPHMMEVKQALGFKVSNEVEDATHDPQSTAE